MGGVTRVWAADRRPLRRRAERPSSTPRPHVPSGMSACTGRHSSTYRHVAMIEAMDEITLLQSEVLRTLAHPRRIAILHELAGGPIGVGRLAARVGASQPNVSQHLATLRAAGLVEFERDGREVRYRLADRRVTAACELMRAVIADRLMRLGDIARAPTAQLPNFER